MSQNKKANKDNTLIWMDGQYCNEKSAKVNALSQTFQYGFGVYEGIRSYQAEKGIAIFRLNDHVNRLFESARSLGISIPHTQTFVCETLCKTLQKSQLKNAYLRPVIFLGDEFLGLHSQFSTTHLMIAVLNWENRYLTQSQICEGISAKISSYKRTTGINHLSQVKANGLYIDSILANNEARSAGYDEAILLDNNGNVAEGSGANIFIAKNGKLYTPKTMTALNGITRKTIFETIKLHKLALSEKKITKEMLYESDEVFFTGTAAEILPITRIDNKKIGAGTRGPLTKKLQQHYHDIVSGRESHYQKWLSYIT